MDDWALGVKQVNPIAFYWTRIYVWLTFSGPAVAFYEHTWPLPLPLLLGSFVALFGMLYVGKEYDGIVKAMGLPHAIGVGMGAGVTAKWVLVDGMVTFDETPISFAWAWVTAPFCFLMTLVDLFDIIEWYVWHNRKVTRSQETVQNFIKKGLLPKDTTNVQWLMKRGKVANERCNEYGFLRK
jgi:hypothetical protein